MLEKLQSVEKRYKELNRLLSDPEVATDPDRLREYGQERAELEPLVERYGRYKEVMGELESTREMLDENLGVEMEELVRDEVGELETERDRLEEEMKRLLVPKDPRDKKDVIVEIRAGTGGEEAALFAADLYRMYTRHAERQGWRTEVLSSNPTGIGGYKEIIFRVEGDQVFSRLKFESGVHRVQRVPQTETSGRIHTSTATVAVLPEMEEVEVRINPNDLRIDTFRASGKGGQHVNVTDSAVRITHLPSGMVVSCQDERSQQQNRARAMSILRARLFDKKIREQREERAEARRSQVGSGERAEKIRTYNFPQNRVTDHRINLTDYQLEDVLDGELDEFIEALVAEEQAERLEEAVEVG